MGMREEFELWSAEHYVLGEASTIVRDDGEYDDSDMQYAWEAWQASRAGLLVDLPQQSGVNLDWNQAIRYCHQALLDAGVAVKS